MLALGIDPGTAICGYGVVELKNNVLRPVHYGSVFTDKELRPELRLKKVYEEITDVITRFRPEVMSIEKLFLHETSIPLSLLPSPAALCCWRRRSRGWKSWNSHPCRSSRR